MPVCTPAHKPAHSSLKHMKKYLKINLDLITDTNHSHFYFFVKICKFNIYSAKQMGEKRAIIFYIGKEKAAVNLRKYICSAEPTLSLICFIWKQLKLGNLELVVRNINLTCSWCTKGCPVPIKNPLCFYGGILEGVLICWWMLTELLKLWNNITWTWHKMKERHCHAALGCYYPD